MTVPFGGYHLGVRDSVPAVLPEAGPGTAGGRGGAIPQGPVKVVRPKAVPGGSGDGQRGAAGPGGGAAGPAAGRPAGPAERLPAPVGWGCGELAGNGGSRTWGCGARAWGRIGGRAHGEGSRTRRKGPGVQVWERTEALAVMWTCRGGGRSKQ